MSRLIDQAGLTAGSGLNAGAGLYKWPSFNPFDPGDLDPYLLFDAQSSMRGTLEAPTLDLDPRNQETLDVITAVRAGVATYTDASGLIQEAVANTVRVDQTQGAELTPTKFQNIGYTDFNNATLWSKNEATLTSGQPSPTGDNTATKLTATGSDPWVYALINTSAQTNTFSFYCKGEGPTIGKTARVLFWYVGSATGTTQSVDFTYSGEWQRFEFQTTPTGAGTLAYRIDVPSDTAVVGESVYIYGPQLEEGTTASDFVANTTGSPKFTGISATYGPRVPMMLIESSAPNLLPYSEDFSHAGWSKVNNVVITSSSVDAPDGTTNAFKLSELQLTDGDYGLSEYVVTTPSTSYTFSAYLKATSDSDVGKKVRIRIRRSVGTSVASQSEVTLTDEWVRHSVTIDLFSDNTSCWFVVTKDTASPTAEQAEECLIWGAQAETGSVATSYIPTSGSTVTRAADNLDISGSAFTNFFNSGGDGTFYAEFTKRDILSDQSYILTGHSGSQRYFYLNAQAAYLNSYDGAAPFIAYGDIQTTLNRASVSYNATHKEGSLNGSTVSNVTSTGDLRDSTRLSIGQSWNGNSQMNGHIKRLIYWPTSSDRL